MSSTTRTAGDFDRDLFRDVVGHFASGVSIITTIDEGVPFGSTVSAVSSLSMEPPMMLVCLNGSSTTHAAVERSGRYAINILSAQQGEIAAAFARRADDKFERVSHSVSDAGLPLIAGALATIECEVVESPRGGTHTIFIGRVISASAGAGHPLTYYRGRFGVFEDAQERAAYAAMRRWVLGRRTPVGDSIDIEKVAEELRLQPASIYNALIRLAAQPFVGRGRDGEFLVESLTADTIDALYDARAVVEAGVLEAHLESADDQEIAEIAERSRQLLDMEVTTEDQLDEFLDANLEFHCAIVGLARSRPLVDRFREFSVAPALRGTYQDVLWQTRAGHGFVDEMTRAVLARDSRSARTLAKSQVAFVKRGAREAVERLGGSI